jgi:ATP-dependent protease ClpP protease subunit
MEPPTHNSLLPDWSRAVFIQRDFDSHLLQQLTPEILRLRSEPKPITIGLDSFGGEIRLLEGVVSLLTTKDKDGNPGQYTCVVTHNAFSAAALLLTWADYSIAYPHAKILFHDTRFSKLTNVTPSRALETARDLQTENDRLALTIAKRVTKRLVWVYIDKSLNFETVRSRYAEIVDQVGPSLEAVCPRHAEREIDVLGFALTLLDGVEGEPARQIVTRALKRLTEWTSIEHIEREITNYETAVGKHPRIVDAINSILRAIKSPASANETNREAREINPRLQDELKLLLEIVLKRVLANPTWTLSGDSFSELERDFELIRGLRTERQAKEILRMMLESKYTFLGSKVADNLSITTEITERKKILEPFFPQARLFWHFCVLLCRTMFEGENLISARDAQWLGVVDEVLGGGPIESRREFLEKNAENSSSPKPAPTR